MNPQDVDPGRRSVMKGGCASIWTIYSASAFRELWKKEGEQDARLNSVERKHEGWSVNIIYSPVNIRCIMEGKDDQKTLISSPPI